MTFSERTRGHDPQGPLALPISSLSAPSSKLVFTFIPLVSFLFVRAGGEVYIGEVILLLCLPGLLAGAAPHARRSVRRFWIGGTVWCVGIVTSGYIHHSAITPTLRLFANAAFTVSDVLAIGCVFGSLASVHRRRAITTATFCLATAGIVGALLRLNPLVRVSVWKFGLGIPVALLCALSADALRGRVPRAVAALPLLVPFALSVALDYRSLGGFCLLTMLLVLRRPRRREGVHARGRVGVLILGIAVSWLALSSYQYAVMRGLFGGAAKARYVLTVGADHSPLGVIVGGRKEIPFSLYSLSHHWLTGMGSLPRLSAGEFQRMSAFYSSRHNPLTVVDLQYFHDRQLPLHSYLFAALLTAGILALPFWGSVASALWRRSTAIVRNGETAVVCFLTVAAAWDYLFSPLGASGRLLFAYSLVFINLGSGANRSLQSPVAVPNR